MEGKCFSFCVAWYQMVYGQVVGGLLIYKTSLLTTTLCCLFFFDFDIIIYIFFNNSSLLSEKKCLNFSENIGKFPGLLAILFENFAPPSN